jgi:hypothetical protein
VFFGRIFAGGGRASRGLIASRGLRNAQAAEQRPPHRRRVVAASTAALLPPAKNALSATICFASLVNSASIACAGVCTHLFFKIIAHILLQNISNSELL